MPATASTRELAGAGGGGESYPLQAERTRWNPRDPGTRPPSGTKRQEPRQERTVLPIDERLLLANQHQRLAATGDTLTMGDYFFPSIGVHASLEIRHRREIGLGDAISRDLALRRAGHLSQNQPGEAPELLLNHRHVFLQIRFFESLFV